MSQRTFYLRLPGSGNHVEWLSYASDGALRSGSTTLDEVAAEIGGAPLVVVVPITAVSVAQVTLPPVKRAQQRQSALYALEDQLIDDVEELHAALGERDSNGQLPLIIARRGRIVEWLELLAIHHLRPQQLLVDALLLPCHDGEWSLLWEDDGIRLRSGPHRAFGFEHGAWHELWPRLLSAAGEYPPKRLQLFDGRTHQEEPLPVAELLPAMEVAYQPNKGGLRWIAPDAASSAINLLQERFSRREQWGQLLRPWRPAAVLLLLWLTLQISIALLDLRSQHQEEARLDQQMEQLYRATFPEARKVVDARLQMEQRLSALKGSSGGFIKLVSSAAPALKSANARLKQMRYQNGALDIELSLADMASLDALRSALVASGLQVEIGNTATQEGRLESHLTLHGGGA